MSETQEIQYFDLRVVYQHFNQSLLQDEDVAIESFMAAFTELFKFFKLMGSVFTFVSSDLKQKVDVLQNLYNDNPESYHSIKSMIDYEKENNILEKAIYVNGSRTLLRLHRGLEFMLEFLCKLDNLSDNDNTSSCCREAYKKTLSNYHPWLVTKAAGIAMYTMPKKKIMYKKVFGDNVQSSVNILPKLLKVTADVLNRTELIYEKHKLLSLP